MRFHAFLSGEPEQTPPASSPARVRRMGCCMAWKGNCFVKYRDEYLGLLSVFFCPVCWTKKKCFFIFVRWVGRNFVKYVEYNRKICEKQPTNIP